MRAFKFVCVVVMILVGMSAFAERYVNYYEMDGMQNDVSYIKERMYEEGCYFKIQESGGVMVKKNDRIRWLIPTFESGKMWFPYQMKKTLVNKETVDMVDIFIKEEYTTFPFSKHDDMLDCLSRIRDPNLNIDYPYNAEDFKIPERPFSPFEDSGSDIDWRDM